ncbi:MAG: cysteate synthase [Spirochaetales bacterium]|nr:cysteate synthase [Spirochaetales bacterium]
MHYSLRCTECGADYSEGSNSFRLSCDAGHAPALLRAEYRVKDFLIDSREAGMYRYRNWLPIRRTYNDASGPVVYHGKNLGARLQLDNLYIAFNGFNPEKGADMETCSFKELEALAVLGRTDDKTADCLVVASAGNTGRSFLQIASKVHRRVCIVVPASALSEMWITVPKSDKVLLVALENADYFDAIRLGDMIAGLPGFYPEGGAKNVARRDGMGTVLLAAAEALGTLPEHYFQAVGSGTGGIAAWEMSKRLLATGRFGSTGMKLHLVQNLPFAIIHDAWSAGSRNLPSFNDEEAKEAIARLWSPVLSNRKPPYGITGGVFDALKDTGGITYALSSEKAREAGRIFKNLEGCDLDPAAAVALAGLMQARKMGRIKREDLILLNITGGGNNHPFLTARKKTVEPDIIFRRLPGTEDELQASMEGLLSGNRIPQALG